MSTMENHNDNLFRESLGSYREMPSDKVWAGVAGALDKDKKKRRFAIWWWTGGIGFAAVAVLLGVIFLNQPTAGDNSFAASNDIATHTVNTVTQTKNTEVRPQVSESSKEQVNQPIASNNNSSQASRSIRKNNPKTIRENSNAFVSSQHKNDKHKTNSPNSKSTRTNASNTKIHTATNGIPLDEENTSLLNDVANSSDITTRENIGTLPSNKQIRIQEIPAKKIHASSQLSLVVVPSLYATNDSTRQSALTIMGCISAPPMFTPIFSVQGNSGAVGYHRQEKNTSAADSTAFPLTPSSETYQTKAKPFGWYNAVSVKAGFIFRNQLYVTAGVGYESQRFSSRETFYVPGASSSPGLSNSSYDILAPFGNVSLPATAEDINSSAQTLQGKLIYQNHHLFIPIDIGYKFSYKRFGVNLGVSSAFHVPLAQKATFISDGGDVRSVNVNKQSPFNFSIGFEPMLEYRAMRLMSITAGGTFRYSVLNSFQNSNSFSRPYVLAGNVGLRFYLR